MPPRSSPSARSGGSYFPPNDSATYRDLLLFEERLKTNAANLKLRKHKYQLFLFQLLFVIAFLLCEVILPPHISILAIPYKFVLQRILPDVYTAEVEVYVHPYLSTGLLFVSVTTLLLFFASGMYSEKIGYANKYVPHANRALRSFNMYLNVRKPPLSSKIRWNPLAFFFPRPAPSSPSPSPTVSTSRPTSPSPTRTPTPSSPSSPTSPSHHSHSHSRTHSTFPNPVHSSTTHTRSSRSPSAQRTRSPSTTRPIHTIPPASNPRGELIFSSRVDRAFREAYERYRAAFERRREEKQWEEWRRGWVGRVLGWAWRPTLGGQGDRDREKGMEKEKTPPSRTASAMGSVRGRSSRPATPNTSINANANANYNPNTHIDIDTSHDTGPRGIMMKQRDRSKSTSRSRSGSPLRGVSPSSPTHSSSPGTVHTRERERHRERTPSSGSRRDHAHESLAGVGSGEVDTREARDMRTAVLERSVGMRHGQGYR